MLRSDWWLCIFLMRHWKQSFPDVFQKSVVFPEKFVRREKPGSASGWRAGLARQLDVLFVAQEKSSVFSLKTRNWYIEFGSAEHSEENASFTLCCRVTVSNIPCTLPELGAGLWLWAPSTGWAHPCPAASSGVVQVVMLEWLETSVWSLWAIFLWVAWENIPKQKYTKHSLLQAFYLENINTQNY